MVGGRTAFEDAVRADLAAHPPVMDEALREGLALEAHARACLPLWFPAPEDLAAALGLVVLRDRACLPGQVAFGGGVVAVRPRGRASLDEGLGVLHELAHHLLGDRHHSHGDVWLLALALGVPRDRVERVGLYRVRMPGWAVGIRLEMLVWVPSPVVEGRGGHVTTQPQA